MAPLVTKSLLLDIAKTGDRYVAVGERGHIVVSDDNAKTWKQVSVPTRVMLTGVYFADANNGWAVGHDVSILKTVDGGSNWKVVYSNPQEDLPLLDVWFENADKGFAIGAYGYFLFTMDGGVNWQRRYLSEEEDFHLNHIFQTPGGDLYISAEAGRVYHSTDGGLNWRSVQTPYGGSFFAGLTVGEDILVFGLLGNIYASSDNGESWISVGSGTQSMLNSGLILDDGRLLLVGLEGIVLIRAEKDKPFMSTRLSGRPGISKIIQAKDGALIAVGETGIKNLSLDELQFEASQ
jgi:photosystem II stability/assembly factor-like uncharacterized protein